MNVLIIIILLCFILFRFYRIYHVHKQLTLKNGISIEMINSEIANSIPACNIANPILDNKFTYSFWIYIKDFYYNSDCKCWKHIFHKGTYIKESPANKFQDWNSITSKIPEQSIGVWLEPNVNNLRVAMNVNESIQYKDVTNIPSKKLVNITITVNKNFMEIYMNGKSHSTKVFTDNISFNNKPMYFNYQYTYSGKLFNFLYIPKLLTVDEIQTIAQKTPNLKTQ